MDLRAGILEMMERSRGIPVSGQELAGRFGVSRAAVWKAVDSLRAQGYEITSAKGTGYLLSAMSDRISASGILARMESPKGTIRYFETIPSTNSAAREAALAGAQHGAVFVADEQTAGRGRSGNAFQSPKGLGLYMSAVVRTDRIGLESPVLCTLYAAAAAVLAIERTTGEPCALKWVNDVLMRGKKVCGILSEGILDFESGHADWLVIGYGVNVRHRAFPPDLPFAGAVQREGDGTPLRCALAAAILDRLLSEDFWADRSAALDTCRSRLTCIGKTVRFSDRGEEREGVAAGLADDGRLLIRMADGTQRALYGPAHEVESELST